MKTLPQLREEIAAQFHYGARTLQDLASDVGIGYFDALAEDICIEWLSTPYIHDASWHVQPPHGFMDCKNIENMHYLRVSLNGYVDNLCLSQTEIKNHDFNRVLNKTVTYAQNHHKKIKNGGAYSQTCWEF